MVAPDTYHVSPEPMLLVAELHGALALCLHDEERGVGGLLHLRFKGGTGRPSDVTDNTLSSVLVVLDRFKRAVLGNSPGAVRDDDELDDHEDRKDDDTDGVITADDDVPDLAARVAADDGEHPAPRHRARS